MKDLSKYVKGNGPKMDSVQTSVNITQKQKDFVTKNKINLSDMVRDMIDSAMEAKKKPSRAAKSSTQDL